MISFAPVFLFVSLAHAQLYHWPNRLIEELEHLLIDTSGFNSGHFADGVTPCSIYFQGPQTLGRQTTGQWMRAAFHDFATANVAEGTGGIDASIGYETLRPENSGAAMNDSLGYWMNFVNNVASMSDMIALGTTTAMAACDGPSLPFKAGRIDAIQGGAFGVPEPDTDITTTLAQFAQAGFSQAEAIQLTACGHTVGHVHHAGFPFVVGPDAVTPNNTGGGIAFDDTFDIFDNHVVTGYLASTTTNPLVTSFNVSSRSDLRLYLSDSNNTMQGLTNNEIFRLTCVHVMTKQLNTVPRGVQLTDVLPIVVKPVNIQVSVNSQGSVTLTGAIRLLGFAYPANPSRVVTITIQPRDGSAPINVVASPPTDATTGSSVYLGNSPTFFHQFSATIPASKGISSFTITTQENAKAPPLVFNNFGPGYTVQDKAVWVPGQTTTSVNSATGLATVNVVVASLKAFKAIAVDAVFHVPTPIQGTLNPKIVSTTVALSRTGSVGLYDLYTGSFGITTVGNANLRSTLDIVGAGFGGIVKDDFRKLSALPWSS